MPASWIAASRSAIAAGVPAIVSSRSASSRPSGDGATRTQPVSVDGGRVAAGGRARDLGALAERGDGGQARERAVVVDRVAPARRDLHRARLAAGDPDRRSAGGRSRRSDVGIGDRVEAAVERRRAVADQPRDDLDRLAEPRHVRGARRSRTPSSGGPTARCRCRAPGSRARRSPRRAPAPSSRTARATGSACRRSAARSRSSSSPRRAPSGSSSTPRSRARRRPRTCPRRAPRRRARARGSRAIAASRGRRRARSGRRGRSGASSRGHHAADGSGRGSRVSNRLRRTRVTRLQGVCDLGAGAPPAADSRRRVRTGSPGRDDARGRPSRTCRRMVVPPRVARAAPARQGSASNPSGRRPRYPAQSVWYHRVDESTA